MVVWGASNSAIPTPSFCVGTLTKVLTKKPQIKLEIWLTIFFCEKLIL